MAISFLQQFDTSLKTVLYDKFKDLLGGDENICK